MTDPKFNLNPFNLPGMGQTGDAASNPIFASMEMMRQAISGLGKVGTSPSLAPTLNPEELERRIQELKVVENWLKLNLSMLSSTIQGLEVQHATISTIRAFMGAGVPVVAPKAEPEPTGQKRSSEQDVPPRTETSSHANGASHADASSQVEGQSAEPVSHAVPAAAKAWWDMLETQFKQVAAATAATLAPKPTADTAGQGMPSDKQSSGATKTSAARKSSVRRSSSAKSAGQSSRPRGSGNS